MALKKDRCGYCNKDGMEKIPIPSDEQGSWYSFLNGIDFILLGKVGSVSRSVLEKVVAAKRELVEVVPQQWGCLDCGTIHTYWYRKDGKEGVLFKITNDRKKGHGRPLVTEMPGTMN